jgi:hypothetical protein
MGKVAQSAISEMFVLERRRGMIKGRREARVEHGDEYSEPRGHVDGRRA